MTVQQPHGNQPDVSPNGSGQSAPEWASGAERQAAARSAYVQSVADGTPLTGVALGAMFDRSGRWGSQRILEARRHRVSDGPGTGSPPNGSGLSPNGRGSPPIGRPENSPTAGRQADREHRVAATAPGSANPTISRTTTLAVLAVALVAAIASYDHQRLLADMAGGGPGCFRSASTG
jgi:hypothetical protein